MSSESKGLSRTGAQSTPATAETFYRSGARRSADLDRIDLESSYYYRSN